MQGRNVQPDPNLQEFPSDSSACLSSLTLLTVETRTLQLNSHWIPANRQWFGSVINAEISCGSARHFFALVGNEFTAVSREDNGYNVERQVTMERVAACE